MIKRVWNDHLVLVTGAGHGLGREISLEIARAGARVIVTDRDELRAQGTHEEILKAGGKSVFYQMDVGDLDSIRRVRDEVETKIGTITGLVNNAGIVMGGEFQTVSLENHLRMLDINTLGVVRVTHLFFPHLLVAKESSIINIASASAFLALPFGTSYAASKWAVLGFSDSLREELKLKKQSHVSVMTVCPSFISTGMFHGVSLPWLMKWVSPQKLAVKIRRAIEKGKENILSPWNVLPVPLAKGLLPKRWFISLCRCLGVSQSMTSWEGH